MRIRRCSTTNASLAVDLVIVTSQGRLSTGGKAIPLPAVTIAFNCTANKLPSTGATASFTSINYCLLHAQRPTRVKTTVEKMYASP